MKKEIWKKIKGYKYYEISNLGRVRSYRVKNKTLKTPILKNIEIDIWGYQRVTLSNNSKVKHLKVHRLVALAFIPNHLKKKEINHKNGIKTDNRIENLEWCTRGENMVHLYRVEKCPTVKGEQHGQSVLSEKEVRAIFKKYKTSKISHQALADEYRVARPTISAIFQGLNWKHLNLVNKRHELLSIM